MEYTPKKVFVLENGTYLELSCSEFRQKGDTYSGRWFIPSHGMLMEVPEDAYKAFYKRKRRDKYLKERSKGNGDFSYDMLTTDEFNGEDILSWIRIAEIDAEFKTMLQAIATDTVEDFDEQRATKLMAEKNSLEQQLAQFDNAQQEKEIAESRLDEIFTILDGLENHPMEYDDRLCGRCWSA